MRKKISRKELLELSLRAIDMPVLTVKIYEYNKWWSVADYPELKTLMLAELASLA